MGSRKFAIFVIKLAEDVVNVADSAMNVTLLRSVRNDPISLYSGRSSCQSLTQWHSSTATKTKFARKGQIWSFRSIFHKYESAPRRLSGVPKTIRKSPLSTLFHNPRSAFNVSAFTEALGNPSVVTECTCNQQLYCFWFMNLVIHEPFYRRNHKDSGFRMR